jgi:hypothetical protein
MRQERLLEADSEAVAGRMLEVVEQEVILVEVAEPGLFAVEAVAVVLTTMEQIR